MINYIRRLPPGSQLDIEQRGEVAYWTLTDHLLRSSVNATIAGNYQRGGKRAPAGAFIPDPARGTAKQRARADQMQGKTKGVDDLNALFDKYEGRS